MREHNVAFISESLNLRWEELEAAAAAVQKQVRQHLAPAWNVSGTVMAFRSREDVPPCFSPIVIVDDVDDRRGFHNTPDGKPYAIVDFSPHWSLVASHETLEMLVDPTGNALTRGLSPIATQGEVEYLVEICDPCEARRYAYWIDGVEVADFCTPSYYAKDAGQRDHAGHLGRHAEVLPGGTVAWRSENEWFQLRCFGRYPTLTLLGEFDNTAASSESRRARINRLAPQVYDWMTSDVPVVTAPPPPPPSRRSFARIRTSM